MHMHESLHSKTSNRISCRKFTLWRLTYCGAWLSTFKSLDITWYRNWSLRCLTEFNKLLLQLLNLLFFWLNKLLYAGFHARQSISCQKAHSWNENSIRISSKASIIYCFEMLCLRLKRSMEMNFKKPNRNFKSQTTNKWWFRNADFEISLNRWLQNREDERTSK